MKPAWPCPCITIMHLAAMAPLQKALTVQLLLASTLIVVAGGSAGEAPPSSAVYHFELIHVDAGGNFSRDELMRRAEHRSRARATSMSSSAADADAAGTTDGSKGTVYLETASYSDWEYLMNISIGSPAQHVLAVADTGSGVTWTRKHECNPNSYSRFTQVYGTEKIKAEGPMAMEVLDLPCKKKNAQPCDDKAVTIPVGCAKECLECNKVLPDKSDGIVGLNRSPKSLLSVLLKPELGLGITKFSYCLSNRMEPDLRSHIWFGGAGLSLPAAGGVPSTRLVNVKTSKDPAAKKYTKFKQAYYVELEGISLSGKDASRRRRPRQRPLKLKHRSKENGRGIMMVDSGNSFTHLESDAFEKTEKLVGNELGDNEPVRSTDKEGNTWSTCFRTTKYGNKNTDPDIVLNLHFGGGSKMALPWSSYMHDVGDGRSCLTITNSGDEVSILGNFQQQNIHMLFDLQGKMMSFVRVQDCSKQEINW